MAKTTRSDLVRIAEDVVSAARDNAFETVRENTAKAELAKLGSLDLHPQFEEWVRLSARMILDDISGRAHRDYGYERPLTDKQAEKVRQMICSQGVAV